MKTILILCMLTINLVAVNTYIATNPSTIDFTQTIAGTEYEETLWVKNNTLTTLNVDLTNYNSAFSLSSSFLTIPAQDSTDIIVTFSSEQNIYFQDILLITDDDLSYTKGIYLIAENHYSDAFYDQTYNLYDVQLKNELTDLVDDHNSLGYIPAKEEMFGYIDNEDGQVQCVYTGEWYAIPEGEMPNQNVFNCEHTWPQSMGAEGTAKSDIHHLFPTFADVNSIRGNLPFGNVVNATWQEGGSLKGYNESNVLVFEPRDPHKGDCTRALFYFSVRYGNLSNFLTSQENTLRVWYYEDPVSTKEINRNNAIEERQDNRNPFIDHPEFLSRIFSLSSNSTTPLTYLPEFQPSQLNFGTLALNQQKTLYFSIANTGTGTLDITGITINSANYSPDTNAIQVSSGDYAELGITFASSSSGDFPATMSFVCCGINYQFPLNTVVNNVSVNEEIIEPSFEASIFPNPINLNKNDDLNIRINSKKKELSVKAEIFDIRGKKITEYTLINSPSECVNNIKIDNPGKWQSGMYLCRITCGESCQTKKLMILK